MLNKFALGGCCCEGACLPCDLAAADLDVAYEFNWTLGPPFDTGSVTLAYTGTAAGVKHWITACEDLPNSPGLGNPRSFKFEIACDDGSVSGLQQTIYTYHAYSLAGCLGTHGTVTWTEPSHAGGLTLMSHVCSPLSLVFSVGGVGTINFTVTS